MVEEDWGEADTELGRLRDAINLQISDDFRDFDSDGIPQQTIYHYTSVKSALGIIQSGRFWFTERAHLNDPVEIQYGLRIAHELFEREARRRSAIQEYTFTHFQGTLNLELVINGFWIASFSRLDDHLGQWRNYADNGRGVCLGFSAEKFNMAKLAQTLPITPNSLRFLVDYDEGHLRMRLLTHINLGLDVLQRVRFYEQPSYTTPNGRALLYERDFLYILNQGCLASSLLHKHPAYADEQEYRLLISGQHDSIARSNHHCLREREREIVEYLNLPIPDWKQPGVLTHIRLGPAAPDELKDQFRTALMKLNIPMPQIDKSDIPFRPIY